MAFAELRDFLRNHLVNDVVPFWFRHAIDWEHGGLFTAIKDDGAIVNRNKYMWSNARALYTFAALVNRIEDRAEWRQAAENQYRFCRDFGRDENGCWVYLVDETGKLIEGRKSIATDLFSIFGMVEYFRMTNDEEALAIGSRTVESIRDRFERNDLMTYPYPVPEGMRAHRFAMQRSLAFCDLAHELDDHEMLEEGLLHGSDVLDNFYRPRREVHLEYIGLDNEPQYDRPEGRAMVPGHGIESFWFQIRNFTRVGQPGRAKLAGRAMRCCFEKGWDPEYGGLLLGLDVDAKEPPYWKHADKKLWWPHTEAIPGALMAYEQLGEDWCLDWYWKCHDWAFAHFPVEEHGEWTNRLDRTGTQKVTEVIALPVKDPFHLPRGLIIAIETLDRLIARKAAPDTDKP